ncbi:hypothetical protein MKEN_01019900 [Mycena kentingensis (nom. inval.)]|nr:hypothetical protein MKEN_01019900 [Mycena kentingensis (nom. inval.)]
MSKVGFKISKILTFGLCFVVAAAMAAPAQNSLKIQMACTVQGTDAAAQSEDSFNVPALPALDQQLLSIPTGRYQIFTTAIEPHRATALYALAPGPIKLSEGEGKPTPIGYGEWNIESTPAGLWTFSITITNVGLNKAVVWDRNTNEIVVGAGPKETFLAIYTNNGCYRVHAENASGPVWTLADRENSNNPDRKVSMQTYFPSYSKVWCFWRD